jgi:catechol 2,3-dioxygenase-like lactoylglutathione lyase family enzyme
MKKLSISSQSHMAFRVRDLEQSRAFYERLFGYEPFLQQPLEHDVLERLTDGASRRAVLAMGTLGDKVLELVEYEDLPPEQIGFSHFGLRVRDLDETYRRARDLGVDILVPPTDIQGVRVMFIEDPDGNRFEIGEFAEWPPPESET